tara:strand:+ start:279 stop:734 length:456 start_codon:yes stop_codon:yes gene_type:complete
MSERQSILIVEARFYTDVADQLVEGAVHCLESSGISYERIDVPGVFEIPAAVGMAIHSFGAGFGANYLGFVALGCVIRGETTHYDYVCGESARALMDLTTEHSLALGFGILTCENITQARIRADIKKKNKGGEAARACLRMIEVKQQYRLD